MSTNITEEFYEKQEWTAGREPFILNTPLPNEFVYVPRYEEELNQAAFMLQHNQGMVSILSPIGYGKSAFLRKMKYTLEKNKEGKVILIEKPLTHHEMLSFIYSQIHTPSFLERLTRIFSKRKTPEINKITTNITQQLEQGNICILIDEFQEIDETAARWVRTLHDSGASIVFAGTEDSIDTIRRKVPPLEDRIKMRIFLDAFNLDETKELIYRRIAWARGTSDVTDGLPFTDEAIEEIHSHSRGVPRDTLSLSAQLVFQAIRLGREMIDEQLVVEFLGRKREAAPMREQILDRYSPQQRSIIQALADYPDGAFISQVLETLGIDNYGSINTQLNRLRNMGVVLVEKVGRKNRYVLSREVTRAFKKG
jgi:type II secretory pathway predicted ATPase ExeA